MRAVHELVTVLALHLLAGTVAASVDVAPTVWARVGFGVFPEVAALAPNLSAGGETAGVDVANIFRARVAGGVLDENALGTGHVSAGLHSGICAREEKQQ